MRRHSFSWRGLLPRSLLAQMRLVAAVGPLTVMSIMAATLVLGEPTDRLDRQLLILAAAALAGTGLTWLGQRAILRPMLRMAEHLHAWGEGWHPGHLPEGSGDDLGRAIRQLNRLMDQASARLGCVGDERHIDSLTGALTQEGLEARIAEVGAGWFLQFGLDNFEVLERRWGRDAADEAVRATVRAARGVLRPGDILARLGEGDLMVVLPALTLDEARGVAERLRRAVEMRVRTKAGLTSVSVGLALHPGGPEVGSALAQATSALATARVMGRNRICEAPTLVQAA
ncbi:GGDEF domain-containing protein [Rubellimicrobium arenae]|uniref:GGDEF domain-containing protein n=1 Tax=Rubellimicrobium arenae TaxID=2817372 RepID=UPI001B3079C5|nr:GGDEF domain-containing protein [Rubellimicrobium arenae]